LRDLSPNPDGVAFGANDVGGAFELITNEIIVWFARWWGTPLGRRFRVLPGETHDVFIILVLFARLPAFVEVAKNGVAHFRSLSNGERVRH